MDGEAKKREKPNTNEQGKRKTENSEVNSTVIVISFVLFPELFDDDLNAIGFRFVDLKKKKHTV